MKRLVLLLPVVLLVVCVSVVQANTIHVPGDSLTIQAGINGAVDGDTVLVADGTYTGDGNRDIDFLGKAIVVMSENGAESCIIDCEGYQGDEHRGFYFHTGEDSTSVLQGFTITNGWIDGNGGGMLLEDSSPMFTNCTFSGNSVSFGGNGGGMYNRYSNPTVSNCMFIGNSAQNFGGGMYNEDSNPTVTNCTFIGNSGAFGGGMSNHWSNPMVRNCILWGDIGGEIYNANSSPIVTYSNVEGGYAGVGNIDEDPMFVLADKNDYRLLWDSPCIDTGDPGSFDPDGTRSDMGAYFFNQDDYLTLYMTPDTTEVAQGGQMSVTYTIINRWPQQKPFSALTRVILPDGEIRTVLGPEEYHICGGYTARFHLTYDIPPCAYIGIYEYKGLIGLPPSTLYDRDSFKFRISHGNNTQPHS